MKSDAFLHASEGLHSPEISKLAKIDRFGLEAVTGRKMFYYGELRRLIVAENIVTAYRMRQAASNWATWAQENREIASLLMEAEKLANATGNG